MPVSRGVIGGVTRSGKSALQAGGGGVAGVASTVQPKNPPTGLMIADADPGEPARLLSPAERKRAELQTKFHPSILAVVDRMKNKGAATADEVKFVRDGKASFKFG